MNRSTWYYPVKGESEENLAFMRLLDEQYTRTPFYGVRKMTKWLRDQNWQINPKRVRRLMRLLGLEAIYGETAPFQAGAWPPVPLHTSRRFKIGIMPKMARVA